MHLNLDDTIPTARLTSATGNIEGESSLCVTHCLCILRVREQIADQIENTCVSCRIRTWASADRRLVDVDNLIQLIQSCDIIMFARFYLRPVQRSRQMLIQDLIDKRTFSGTGYACHTGHYAKWELHINILQIVLSGTKYLDISGWRSPLFRYRNLDPAA